MEYFDNKLQIYVVIFYLKLCIIAKILHYDTSLKTYHIIEGFIVGRTTKYGLGQRICPINIKKN